jgi:hypothetical protein
VALQPDGAILIGGIDGQARAWIARVKGTNLISPAPQLNASRANGRFRVQFTGASGRTYTFQTSTNLVDWATFGPATDRGNGLFQLDDAESSNLPVRYYRVVSP